MDWDYTHGTKILIKLPVMWNIFDARFHVYSVIFLVWLVIFVDMFCFSAFTPIIPSLVKKVSNDKNLHQGLFFSVYAIGLLIFTPLFGILSDFFHDRYYLMHISLGTLTTIMFLFVFAESNIYFMLVLRFIQGAAAAGNWTVGLALIADCCTGPALFQSMGIVLSAMHLASSSAPLISGALYQNGFQNVAFLCMGLGLFNILMRFIISHEKCSKMKKIQFEKESIGKIAAKMIRSYSIIRARPIWVNFLCCFVFSSVISCLETVIPFFLDADNLKEDQIGRLMLAFTVPGLILSSFVGYMCSKLSCRPVMLFSIISLTIYLSFLQFATDLTSRIFLFTGYGILHCFISTPPLPEMGQYTQEFEPEKAGRVYSLFSVAFALGMILGSAIGASIMKLDIVLYVFTGVLGLLSILYVIYIINPKFEKNE